MNDFDGGYTSSSLENIDESLEFISNEQRIIYRNTSTPYTPTCIKIMDFFIDNVTLYFTPMTAYKSLDVDVTPDTVKSCMNLLLKNSYLTKEGGKRTNYYSITKENMEFWVTDFRKYVLELEKLKQPFEPKHDLQIDNVEDDE
ncbi:MAG: hypothetical protein HRU07_06790 [Nitrosopumilus sp.]|nr:hypothetical protein [Nitrosopumilus sp.]NRA05845.1 hypothetical protein [Nitrosopumilus sp.]